MRLLVFSDIHGDLRALERLMGMEADAYVAAGDLVTWSRGLDAVGPVLQRRAPRVWVLPGNHEHASQTARFCERYGLHDLHGKSFDFNGWRVAGLGHSNPTPFNTPGEYSEAELAERLAPFAGLEKMVLVCHCPPWGTALDEAAPGRHFGSRAVLEFIERNQPEWFFCGHIHEAEGREARMGATRGVNVGKDGYVVELDASPAAARP
ncbi:MAG: metallophosphoesterase [Candidatus Solibacter usitatus]|nr:metallophosphoesterase [Candidatus Solibacter usitatus]